jgi:hypothetical protein
VQQLGWVAVASSVRQQFSLRNCLWFALGSAFKQGNVLLPR